MGRRDAHFLPLALLAGFVAGLALETVAFFAAGLAAAYE
jgi:hypothetical protein